MAKLVGTAYGRVMTDPETGNLPSGVEVVKFSMPLDSGKKLDDGTYPPTSAWVKVSCFGKSGEFVRNYVKKGDTVIAIGNIKVSNYLKKADNSPMTSIEMTASLVNIASSANQGYGQQGQQNQQGQFGGNAPSQFGAGGNPEVF